MARGDTTRRNAFSMEMVGMDDLLRRLALLPDRLEGRYLREAVEAGSLVLVEFMKALAPRGAGPDHAYTHIASGLDRSKLGGGRNIEFSVGPTGDGYYLSFHETGTSKMAPSPFMRPAVFLARDEVIETVASNLRRNLARAIHG